jgi:hypothetical protein
MLRILVVAKLHVLIVETGIDCTRLDIIELLRGKLLVGNDVESQRVGCDGSQILHVNNACKQYFSMSARNVLTSNLVINL